MGHTFSTLSAITDWTRFSSSSLFLPAWSNVHACELAIRCMPQYSPPHLHSNPVSPTFFLHSTHLFFFGFFSTEPVGFSAPPPPPTGIHTEVSAAASGSGSVSICASSSGRSGYRHGENDRHPISYWFRYPLTSLPLPKLPLLLEYFSLPPLYQRCLEAQPGG